MPRLSLKRRELLRASAVAGLGALGASCTSSTSPATPAAPVVKTDTARLSVAVQPFRKKGWEPWLTPDGETAIAMMIGEQLIDVNPRTGALEGLLAESWSVSPDIKTWTFKLRPNVPFHDGLGTVTAEDVKFSWEQYIRPQATNNLAATLRQAVDGDMKNFQVTGPLEFKVTTTKPVIALAASLSKGATTMTVQSKKYWETSPAKAVEHPVGTGSFQFVSSRPDVEVVVKAVENHWRKTSTFKEIVFKIIQDDAARLAQIASGTLDMGTIPPKLVGEAKNLGLRIQSIPDVGVFVVIFGGMYPGIGDPALGESAAVRGHALGAARYDRSSPWIQADSPAKGRAIRQAMSLAIDRKVILDKLLGGQGTLITAPYFQFPSTAKLMDAALTTPFDLAKAKQMLAEGGYPNGFPITVPIFATPAVTVNADVGEAIAGMWETLGLKVTRRLQEFARFSEANQQRTSAGTASVTISSFALEPVQGMTTTMLPTSSGARLYDAQVSAAVTKANAEGDTEKRFAIYRDILAYMNREMLGIPLFSFDQPFALRTDRIATWTPVAGVNYYTNLEHITAK